MNFFEKRRAKKERERLVKQANCEIHPMPHESDQSLRAQAKREIYAEHNARTFEARRLLKAKDGLLNEGSKASKETKVSEAGGYQQDQAQAPPTGKIARAQALRDLRDQQDLYTKHISRKARVALRAQKDAIRAQVQRTEGLQALQPDTREALGDKDEPPAYTP